MLESKRFDNRETGVGTALVTGMMNNWDKTVTVVHRDKSLVTASSGG